MKLINLLELLRSISISGVYNQSKEGVGGQMQESGKKEFGKNGQIGKGKRISGFLRVRIKFFELRVSVSERTHKLLV